MHTDCTLRTIQIELDVVICIMSQYVKHDTNSLVVVVGMHFNKKSADNFVSVQLYSFSTWRCASLPRLRQRLSQSGRGK